MNQKQIFVDLEGFGGKPTIEGTQYEPHLPKDDPRVPAYLFSYPVVGRVVGVAGGGWLVRVSFGSHRARQLENMGCRVTPVGNLHVQVRTDG